MQYDQLAQDALRSVVRKALERAAGPGGLPGAHHFYITFRTDDPACDIDESLTQSYPEEMTVVLEHQFWDLACDDEAWEVTLRFSGVPKYLRVPWRAVTRFHDPSVGFRLHFDYVRPDPGEAPRGGAAAATGNEGTVVSLDTFRKKD
ncbi:hypothetical protein F1654_11175 [Alkalicaulis satelles]|uniref:Stringent starvation protein B n=1 Tax=Alkalicaulis satelles TaxID=2609175 RepID=A0A5M6ZF07_9PROT|nr:hypothetical protein F1654_11175 [Alkalicaulis satelles]